MTNWFGELQLAYKYVIVFGSLLLLTIVAGVIKVLYNRRKLKKHTKIVKAEEGRREDLVELNHREKDEGDLFGIRAIEAGFYGGVSQSRPTSRAGSYIENPAMSSHTLIGSNNSHHKVMNQSMNSSVTTLQLAHASDRNSPPRKKSPPAIRLAPSEAELNGRINHNAQVNMSLNVPPSPVTARGPSSPTFGGSDDGSSDGRSSPNYRHDHYAPVPPQIPMPSGLQVSVHSARSQPSSQAASFNDPSPSHSPPSSPGYPPSSSLPAVPSRAYGEPPRSLYGDKVDYRSESPVTRHQQLTLEPERPSSPIRLQPQTYQPYQASHSKSNHHRDESDISVYSNQNRLSAAHRHRQSNSTDLSYNYSFQATSGRNSAALTVSTKELSRQPSASSSLNVPGLSQNAQPSDPRLSEFYDAYYRQSQIITPSKESSKRPNLTEQTIEEVPSPLPSPNPSAPLMQQHPGYAM